MAQHIMGETLLIENFVGRWLRNRQIRKSKQKASDFSAKSQYFNHDADLRRALNDHETSGWKQYRNS